MEEADQDDHTHETSKKTPIAFLQDICVKKGTLPRFELETVEGQLHERIFAFVVNAGEFTGSGQGRSKKDAKHAAARDILDKILKSENHGNFEIPEADLAILSPINDEDIPPNPVKDLQELCVTKYLPQPQFDIISEEGLPHDKTFQITCAIGDRKETGIGKSKKLAKRLSAYKMMQALDKIKVPMSSAAKTVTSGPEMSDDPVTPVEADQTSQGSTAS